MGIAYPGWDMDNENELIRNEPRYNEKQDYGEPFNINDPQIFKSFESKINKLRKSDSFEELNKNYKDLAKIYHPDKKNGDHETFIEIKDTYDKLINTF
tara:strand:- start:243 stop:536 length:294 start_codon:yes stop_codon:yes gene_type:complete